MNILNHIKGIPGPNLTVITNPNTVTYWEKPKGCKMVLFLVMSPGGGGGGGRVGAASSARGGGGGGGSGSWTSVLLPAWVVPDRLGIYMEGGAAGGAPSNAGSGAVSGFAIRLGIINQSDYMLFLAGSPLVNGGNAGSTGTASGGAGNGATVINCYTILGAFGTVAGATGSTGSGTVGGTSQSASSGLRNCTPGAGGGGVSSANASLAGGNITGYAGSGYKISPQINGGAGTSLDTVLGENGLSNFYKLLSLGGAGGSAYTGTGYNGGNGGYGSGGGGGAGGTSVAAAAGTGGKGGDGFTIIYCW